MQPGRARVSPRAAVRAPGGELRPIAAPPLTLTGGLLFGPPVHLRFEPPLGQATGAKPPRFGPKLPRRLFQFLVQLRPGEIAAERRVRDAIVAREFAQRFARRATPNQRPVGREPAQAAATFHAQDSSFQLTHHERILHQTAPKPHDPTIGSLGAGNHSPPTRLCVRRETATDR